LKLGKRNLYEHIVSFDEKQTLRYMFLEHKLISLKDDPYDSMVLFQTLREMLLLCNDGRYKREKLIDLINTIISKGDKVIVFTSLSETYESLSLLFEKDFPEMHIGVSSKNRYENAAKGRDFEKGDKRILLATDFFRNISLKNVFHMIHFDYPATPIYFEHRNASLNRIAQLDSDFNSYCLMTENKIDHQTYLKIKKQSGVRS